MAIPQAFAIYLIGQPHQAPSDGSAQLLAQAVGDSNFPGTQYTPTSEWQQRGDRVWTRTYLGALASNDAVYDIRRRQLPEYLQGQAMVDVVVLPIKETNLLPQEGASSPVKPHRPVRLAVFDMDSTLIEQEVIDELARTIGAYDAVAEITERAMRGELDFAGSLRARVALLRGLPHNVWDQVRLRISFACGARELCRELKRQGARMAVLSGGFTPLAEWVASELELDAAHANFLASEPANADFAFEHLNGTLVEGKPIVTAERKQQLLLQLAAEQGIPLSDVLCVGDGANDLKMLQAVGDGGGIAIALKAKPKVQEAAPNKLGSNSMADILYLLNYSQSEIEAAP